MAESVPENSEEETGESRRGRGGETVWLSGRPICQIKAPKNLGGGQKLRPAWDLSDSPLIKSLKKT